MKRKKIMKSFLSTAVMGLCLVSVTSCKEDTPADKDNPSVVVPAKKYTITFDSKGGTEVAKITEIESGKNATKPADPTKDGFVFAGWFTDEKYQFEFDFKRDKIKSDWTLYAKWEAEVIKYTVTFADADGTLLTEQVEEGKKIAKPADPVKDGYKIENWYKDAAKTQVFDFETEVITAATTIYANWVVAPVKMTYTLDSNILSTMVGTLPEKYESGVFTIDKDAVIRDRGNKTFEGETLQYSIRLNGSAYNFSVAAPMDGTLELIVRNGSGGVDTQTLLVNVDGEPAESIVYTAGTNPFEKVTINVEKGKTYSFTCGGTTDLHKAVLSYEVEKGELSGFEIASAGQTKFLEGQEFDGSSIVLNAVYDSNYKEALLNSDITIDSSAYSKDTPGTYDIKVKYGTYAEQTIKVTVYDTQAVESSFYILEKDSTNIWGNNSALLTIGVKTIYFNGENLSKENLTVKVIGVNPNDPEDVYEFTLKDTDYEMTCPTFNNATSGAYEVSITYKGVVDKYNVYVANTAASIQNNTISAKVEKDYIGEIGAVNNNVHMFNTIGQALEYLTNNSAVTDSVKKVLTIGNGTYEEKIDVTIPNLTIIGESRDGVILTYDAANGKTDARGTAHSTDGSATLSIRYQAENFECKNLTVENFYNTLERYNELKKVTSGTQALAIMIQSEKAIFDSCNILGYQDTIEMQGSGRQYFYNCLVQGATDFIFGTNSSALFEGCEIKVISNGQDTNGGYICAPKGNNKGGDKTKFGYIFNNCHFTNDGKVTDGTTAICRPWAADAYITIMNSYIGSHISTADYTDKTTKGQRYVGGLSSAKPTDATVIFQEYNNVGPSALTESSSVMEILTKEVADKLLVDFFGAYEMPKVSKDKEDFKFTAWDISHVKTDNPISLPELATVTFNTNGAGTIAEMVISPGQKIPQITNPTKDDHTFEGWYTDAAFQNKFNIATDVITETTTLYVNWIVGQVSTAITKNTSIYFDKSKEENVEAGLYVSRNESKGGFELSGKTSDNGNSICLKEAGKISFSVAAGAIVTINGYSGHAKYKINGTAHTADQYISPVTTAETTFDITNVTASGDYLVSIIVTFPTVSPSISKNTSIYFDDTQENTETGVYVSRNESKAGFELSGTTSDNGNSLCLKANGKISFKVAAGATVTINGYPGLSKYNINGVANTVDQYVSPVTTEETTFDITNVTASGDYVVSIIVTFPAESGDELTDFIVNFGSLDVTTAGAPDSNNKSKTTVDVDIEGEGSAKALKNAKFENRTGKNSWTSTTESSSTTESYGICYNSQGSIASVTETAGVKAVSSVKTTECGISFEVEGACQIRVCFATNGSSGGDRYIILHDGTVEGGQIGTVLTGSAMESLEDTFSVSKAGKYYVGANNGLRIFAIQVIYAA